MFGLSFVIGFMECSVIMLQTLGGGCYCRIIYKVLVMFGVVVGRLGMEVN